jgi:hypothetical protein
LQIFDQQPVWNIVVFRVDSLKHHHQSKAKVHTAAGQNCLCAFSHLMCSAWMFRLRSQSGSWTRCSRSDTRRQRVGIQYLFLKRPLLFSYSMNTPPKWIIMNHDELNTICELLGIKAPEIRISSDRFSLRKQRRQLHPIKTVDSRCYMLKSNLSLLLTFSRSLVQYGHHSPERDITDSWEADDPSSKSRLLDLSADRSDDWRDNPKCQFQLPNRTERYCQTKIHSDCHLWRGWPTWHLQSSHSSHKSCSQMPNLSVQGWIDAIGSWIHKPPNVHGRCWELEIRVDSRYRLLNPLKRRHRRYPAQNE